MALVPLRYTFRSLFGRSATSLLTVLSTGATVAILGGMLALQQGFATTFQERGRTDLAVIIRKGATSEGQSGIQRDKVETIIKGSSEIAQGEDGQPLASGEIYLAMRMQKTGGAGETNIPIRGVQSATFAIHGDDVSIAEGKRFTPGTDEVLIGASLVGRIQNAAVGQTLVINTTPFLVTGILEAKGAYRGEIWGDADRMMEALERPVFNRVLAKVETPEAMTALRERLDDDRQKQTPAAVFTEQEYLSSQTEALSATFTFLGGFLALIMGIAAVFTGTNSMLSALSARSQEIGILMSVGYRPFAVFVAFLLEAVVLGLLGGILGCLLILPLHGIETGTTNFATFTEAAFQIRITPTVLTSAVVFSLFLGIIGGAIPALRAARMLPTEALRRG